MNINKPIIILVHIEIDGVAITESECRTLLPPAVQNNKIVFIDLEMTKYKREELSSRSFEQVASEQRRKFKRFVKPAIDQNPNATIAYFGLSSIPAAFHLGFLLNGYNNIWIYQQHHITKVWSYETEATLLDDFELLPIEYPTRITKGKGDIFIRVSTSYRIEPQQTYRVLPDPIYEFDISAKTTCPDVVSNSVRLQLLVSTFQKVLNAIVDNLPGRENIHLFLCTSAGIPFALGTQINPTIFPRVQTYQFAGSEYVKAIEIKKQSEDPIELTAAEIKIAQKMRKSWAKELTDKIHPFIENLSGEDWFQQVQVPHNYENCPDPWANITTAKSILTGHKISLEALKDGNGFRYLSRMLSWSFEDAFFVQIEKRFKTKSNVDTLQACWLFMFHEGLHYAPHGHHITEDIATGIGRFPKVIEKTDYQADVWAIFHAYKYTKSSSNRANENLKKFFLDTIDTAVETMWCFLDRGKDLTQIQIRSVNRFLNWYWQWVRIEQLEGMGTFKEISCILLEQPILEFAGADILIEGQKIFFDLSQTTKEFEIAIFYKNKVKRFAPKDIQGLIHGFRMLNGDKIKDTLRNLYATLS